MFKSNEAKEILYTTFSKCLKKKEQFAESLLEEADVRVIYDLRNKCYNYDILMLPDLR